MGISRVQGSFNCVLMNRVIKDLPFTGSVICEGNRANTGRENSGGEKPLDVEEER